MLMCQDSEDNLASVGEVDEREMHTEEVMQNVEEMYPAADSSDNGEYHNLTVTRTDGGYRYC